MGWTIETENGVAQAIGFWDGATAREQVADHFLVADEAWEELASASVVAQRAALAAAQSEPARIRVLEASVGPYEATAETETSRPEVAHWWPRVDRRGRLHATLAVATRGGVYAELECKLGPPPGVSALALAERRHSRLIEGPVLLRHRAAWAKVRVLRRMATLMRERLR